MRPKVKTYEQLFMQYKQELMQDEKIMTQIEMRLEKKQAEILANSRKKFSR